jgi:8-oxo-dGTP pyrophosphatase MutT (NUDIX family)
MEESHGYDVPSAAGLLIICPATKRILLGLRSSSSKEPNTWCNFGGMMQNAENPLETAIRETMEESELKLNNIIKPSFYVNSVSNGFNYYTFIAITDNEIKPKINSEHLDYNWYRMTELPRITLHSGLKKMFDDTNSIGKLKKYI